MSFSYFDDLEIAISAWKADVIVDEDVFWRLSQNIHKMNSEDAFICIDKTIDILMTEDDESTAIEILQVLLSLYRASNTTELPKDGADRLKRLHGKVTNFGEYAVRKYHELIGAYRLSL